MAPTEQLFLRERRFLLGLLLVSGLLVLWVTRAYLAWAILGLILAYVSIPVADAIERRIGGRRVLAAAIVLVLATILVALPLVLLTWAMAGDVANLVGSVSSGGLADPLRGLFGRVTSAENADRWATLAAAQIEHFLVEAAPELIVELIDATVGIFILGSALMSALIHRDALYRWVRRVIPLYDKREEDLLSEVGRAVDAVVFGILVVAVLTAAAGGLLWWASGLPNPLFWTFAIFIVSVVPALGPSLVIFPGAAYAWLDGNVLGVVLLGIGGSLLILAVDVYVRPALIAKKGGLDGTLALLSVMGGIVAMGPIGIFAGPLIMAVFLKVIHLTLETHHLFGAGFANEEEAPAPAPAPATAPPAAARPTDPESVD